MNAETNFLKRRRRPFLQRCRTRAFRTGLREGFGAPSMFLATNEYRMLSSIDSSVSDAWKAVGDALRLAAAKNSGAAVIGKDTGKAEPAGELTCGE